MGGSWGTELVAPHVQIETCLGPLDCPAEIARPGASRAGLLHPWAGIGTRRGTLRYIW